MRGRAVGLCLPGRLSNLPPRFQTRPNQDASQGRTLEMAARKTTLRSREWYGKADKDGFAHRSWMRNQGLPADVFDGRPVIGICNTWSELTPCNAHLRTLADRVKRGVWESGGLPVEFPVTSTGESNIRPTA